MVPDTTGKFRKVYLPMWLRLVQAQTEAEAIAKIELELNNHQKIETYTNLTIF